MIIRDDRLINIIEHALCLDKLLLTSSDWRTNEWTIYCMAQQIAAEQKGWA